MEIGAAQTSHPKAIQNVRDRVVGLRRVKASDLIPNPKNWRKHPKAQADALRGVLAEVGYADALLARQLPDGSLMLVDGHLRAETTPDAEVPVLVLDVTEAEADKILLTLDPLAAMAEADADALSSLLAGFETDSEAVKKMLADLSDEAGIEKPVVDAPDARIDEAEVLREKWGVERGQLWRIGGHRLMCGDSTSAEDVGRLMGGVRAGLLFTSPPYAQQREYGEASKLDDWDGLMDGVFCAATMADDGQVLVNLGLIHRDGRVDRYWDAWLGRMEESGWKLFGWYVWDKISATFKANDGRPYVAHEWVFHFNRRSVPCIEWEECKHAGTSRSVWGQRKPDGHVEKLSTPGKIKTHKPPDTIARVQRETANADAGVRSHPARFPVAFAEYWVKSWPGSVYEPFSGSGTTLVASEQLGRQCYAMEIEPKYVAVALQRLADMGLTPERADG